MRFRHALTVAVLTVAGTLPLAGAAHAQPDRDCADFASQAEAQEALDGTVGDPERLDANDDGVACESYFRDAAATTTQTTEPAPTSAPAEEEQDDQDDPGQVRVLPRGGVDTGDGSTDPDQPASATALVALAGLGLLGVGARRLRQNAG
ncbi:MAG TPA: excalibur calcium-binding domain-containing protein [Pseudonocardia sp.]|jgi:MYXO-CTERM domain-containing protein|nr:excalibur calcium-binding domain-containing protein [Pseudonocardia sp.]